MLLSFENMKMKILKIGEIIKLFGIRLKVTKAVQGCRGCYFKQKTSCFQEIVGACTRPWRDEEVIFRKFDERRNENLHGRPVRGYKIAKRILGK